MEKTAATMTQVINTYSFKKNTIYILKQCKKANELSKNLFLKNADAVWILLLEVLSTLLDLTSSKRWRRISAMEELD